MAGVNPALLLKYSEPGDARPVRAAGARRRWRCSTTWWPRRPIACERGWRYAQAARPSTMPCRPIRDIADARGGAVRVAAGRVRHRARRRRPAGTQPGRCLRQLPWHQRPCARRPHHSRWPACPPSSIVAAMAGYRSGALPATVMHQIAKGFSDDEIKAIAAYCAAQYARTAEASVSDRGIRPFATPVAVRRCGGSGRGAVVRLRQRRTRAFDQARGRHRRRLRSAPPQHIICACGAATSRSRWSSANAEFVFVPVVQPRASADTSRWPTSRGLRRPRGSSACKSHAGRSGGHRPAGQTGTCWLTGARWATTAPSCRRASTSRPSEVIGLDSPAAQQTDPARMEGRPANGGVASPESRAMPDGGVYALTDSRRRRFAARPGPTSAPAWWQTISSSSSRDQGAGARRQPRDPVEEGAVRRKPSASTTKGIIEYRPNNEAANGVDAAHASPPKLDFDDVKVDVLNVIAAAARR